jgi:hypothetical protein
MIDVLENSKHRVAYWTSTMAYLLAILTTLLGIVGATMFWTATDGLGGGFHRVVTGVSFVAAGLILSVALVGFGQILRYLASTTEANTKLHQNLEKMARTPAQNQNGHSARAGSTPLK